MIAANHSTKPITAVSNPATVAMSAALMHSMSGLTAKSVFCGQQVSSARPSAARVAQPLGVRASVVGDGPLGDRWYALAFAFIVLLGHVVCSLRTSSLRLLGNAVFEHI